MKTTYKVNNLEFSVLTIADLKAIIEIAADGKASPLMQAIKLKADNELADRMTKLISVIHTEDDNK